MVKTILFGYRDWAFEIFDALKQNAKLEVVDVITSQEQYLEKCNSFPDDVDFLLFIGWSWIIPPAVTEKFLCLGIHPSDLPNYRGGSPIQNQIMAGIEQTKVTLMTLSSAKLDAGDIWLKEELDLTGSNMVEIFRNLSLSSVKMLNRFIDQIELMKPYPQLPGEGSYFKRRKPEESRITKDFILNADLKTIYNFVRCLTDPYPNAYIEDENGNKLLIKGVEYIEN
jgi:methionyl-tRNA formyltransferase